MKRALRMRKNPCTETVGHFTGTFDRAVQDMDFGNASVPQRLNDGPACTAGSEHHRPVGFLPSRMALIEIGNEAIAIRVGGMQPALFHPDGIGCTQFLRQLVGTIRQLKGRFLVRNGDIATHRCTTSLFL
ncbi:hypothetical protein D3C80_1367110 [compost metagenome]